jgi:hypothetical protein
MDARGIIEQKRTNSMSYPHTNSKRKKEVARAALRQPLRISVSPAEYGLHDSSESETDNENIFLLDFPEITWVDNICNDMSMYEVTSHQVKSPSSRKIGQRRTTKKSHHKMLRCLAVRQKLASLYNDDTSGDALHYYFKT